MKRFSLRLPLRFLTTCAIFTKNANQKGQSALINHSDKYPIMKKYAECISVFFQPFFVNIILRQFDWYLRLEFEINQSALPGALLSWPAWDYWIFQYAYAGIFRKPKKVKRRKVKTKNEQKWLYKNSNNGGYFRSS